METADALEIGATEHVPDIGSGSGSGSGSVIGNPAYCFAHRFGGRVTGIDLTAEFCDLACTPTRQLGLEPCQIQPSSTLAKLKARALALFGPQLT